MLEDLPVIFLSVKKTGCRLTAAFLCSLRVRLHISRLR